MFKLNGFVKVINPTVQVSEKFSKREFVITDNSSQYPQDIMFQLAQDKCDLINPFTEGQEVEVSFNLKGRMWLSPVGEEKYFNTLEAWRIDSITKAQPLPPIQEVAQVPATAAQIMDEDDDGMPF